MFEFLFIMFSNMTEEDFKMSKIFTEKFPNLEILKAEMQSGSVGLRKTLENIHPYEKGMSREAWFFKISQKTGLRKSRIKSVFYNRECRLWGDELVRIHRAIPAQPTQNTITIEQPDPMAQLRKRLEGLEHRQEALKHEILDDIRTLLMQTVQSHTQVASPSHQ